MDYVSRKHFSIATPSLPQFLDKLPGANKLSILRSLAISPDMFQDFPYDWQQLAGLVLVSGRGWLVWMFVHA